MRITLKGNIPSKKNSKIMVCRGRYPILLSSKNYTIWHTEAIHQLLEQKIPKSKLKNVVISIMIVSNSKRKFDLTNKAESIMDLLTDYGLLEDDNVYVVPKIFLSFGGVDKEKPRAEIIINNNYKI